MLIVIPVLIFLSLIFQISSIFSDSFANQQGFQKSCSSDEPICISAKVFSWLGIISTGIPIAMMIVLLFCVFESELFRKKRKNLKMFFKSTRCQLQFIDIHNALLVLLPMSILFQGIAFGTEIGTTVPDKLEPQEGFSLYLISIILMIGALLAHPAINRSE